VSREDIDKLLLSKLPEVLSADQKASRVHNLLTSLSGKRIQNVGTRQASRWAPFSLRIFVADGDPDGLRIVDKSNWIGKALVFPRALLPQVKARPELAQTGVYLLLGPRPDGEGDMLYVGEGDPIRPRLESHYAQKDFWTRAIGFTTTTAGQLNKAHVQFLESRLIALARAAKRLPLDNANQPAEPSLSEVDRADMEVFLGSHAGHAAGAGRSCV
jgi:hypothetical protein